MLGVYWDEDSLEGLFETADEKLSSKGGDSAQTDGSVLWPLSFLIEPRFIEILKKSTKRKYGISAPKWAKEAWNEGNFDNMYEWSAKDFLNFVNKVVDQVAPTTKKGI